MHLKTDEPRWRNVVCRGNQTKQRIYKPVDNSDYSCLKCAELESQWEQTRKELSSSQLVIKLFYKEINDITAEKTPKLSNTISECETGAQQTVQRSI